MLTETFVTFKRFCELPFEFELDFSIHKNPNVLSSLGANKGIILAHSGNWLRHWIGNGCFRVNFSVENRKMFD